MFCLYSVHDQHQQTGREGSSESEVRRGQEKVHMTSISFHDAQHITHNSSGLFDCGKFQSHCHRHVHESNFCPSPLLFPPQDRHHRGTDCKTGQRGMAGTLRPRARPPHPHQREGGAAEGAAVHQPSPTPGAQRRWEAGVWEKTSGERPAGCQRQPEQGSDWEVGMQVYKIYFNLRAKRIIPDTSWLTSETWASEIGLWDEPAHGTRLPSGL